QPQVLPSPQPAQPIRSTGPAQIAPTPAPKPADKVYDRNGRIVPGVRPAGPNRVFDSRTGRYYDSVPAGDGQQIKR
ncbi:MAG TPA: classical arabinogalactan protein 4, partial [Stenotrophomonas sp.]|nr:classical arabinogalactan protein 4 [Stenotrophomonas sp.]